MRRALSPSFILLLFLAVWLALNLLTLAWWPPFDFNGDEAWVLDYLLTGGKAKMMLGWDVAQKGLLLFNTPFYFGYAGIFPHFSHSIWFLRLSSLLAGLLSLAITYLIARDEGHPREGLIAVIILGFSGPFLWTSHYLRWESLTLAMGLLSLWLFLRGTRGNPVQAGLGGLIAGLSVLSHPVGLVFPLAIWFTGFVLSGWKRRIWLWGGLALGAVVFISLNLLPNLGGPLFPDVFVGLSSRPALTSLFTAPKAIPATLLKIIYKPVMLVAAGAEYGSEFTSPILGVLSLGFLFVKSRIRWLWLFLLISFGLLVIRQEYTNILFPTVVLCATLFVKDLRELGFGARPWFLLFLLIPEIYLLQGEFRKGRSHLIARERMFSEVNAILPVGARVVSTSPALLWGGLMGNYRVFRMADPDYLSGRITLHEALLKHDIDYLVVDIMPALPVRSYYTLGITEREALRDTAFFEALGTFPAGYMLFASEGKDNLVDSFRIYKIK